MLLTLARRYPMTTMVLISTAWMVALSAAWSVA